MLKPYVGAAVVALVLGATLMFADPGVRLLWAKSLHVIAVVSWFAGIFYLPRLFVYHAMVPVDDEDGRARFETMERKLYRFVTMFMVLTIFFGMWMLVQADFAYLKGGAWMHVKLTLVTGLIAYHFVLGAMGRRFASGGVMRSHKFYRVINELPVLVLFAVVILVIVKPF